MRMWPRSVDAGPIDFESLPPVPRRDVVWLDGPTITFEAGGWTNPALPPLVANINFADFEVRGRFKIQSFSD